MPSLNLSNKDDLLTTSLTTSESTEFARFVKILNNASWLKEGHDKYHTENGKCPYCKRKLPDDFEEKYKSCFDENYQRSINELISFRKDYEYKLTSFIKGLRVLISR
ncbi:MAG: AAA family ATPase [Candidatus Onthovivens sp.]|nr:AAA family ATPase [Candidatus Onthovivens sp.]